MIFQKQTHCRITDGSALLCGLVCALLFTFSPLALGANSAGCEDSLEAVSVLAETERVHNEITSMLFNGELLEYRRWGKIGFIVSLRGRNPRTNEHQTIKAYLKPRLPGDRNTFQERPYAGADRAGRSPMEYVAYHLNRLLGFDYISPTAYRRDLNITYEGIHITEGSLSLFIEQFETHKRLGTARWDYDVMNVLMHNPDGNMMNSGTGIHWVTGQTSPVFSDFSASFGQMNGFRGGPKNAMISSPELREKLRQLSFEDFRGEIDGNLISETEVRMILEKRDLLLSN